jgi:hypothetical protein
MARLASIGSLAFPTHQARKLRDRVFGVVIFVEGWQFHLFVNCREKVNDSRRQFLLARAMLNQMGCVSIALSLAEDVAGVCSHIGFG